MGQTGRVRKHALRAEPTPAQGHQFESRMQGWRPLNAAAFHGFLEPAGIRRQLFVIRYNRGAKLGSERDCD